jgi:hypothetical protein
VSDEEAGSAADDARTAPAVRTWWQRRAVGLTAFTSGVLALLATPVLLLAGLEDDGNGGLVVAACLLALVGLVVVAASWREVPRALDWPGVRHLLDRHPWRPYEGQLLRTTWVSISGGGDGEGPPAREGRWSLFDRDGVAVLLDERRELSALQLVMRGEAGLWVCGPLDKDPLVLAEGPRGSELIRGRTIRTDRDRARANGQSRLFAAKAGHRTERSPRLPPR